MTTASMFSDAVRRAEESITDPGFNTLTGPQKRVAVLRMAIRQAGGEPAGTAYPDIHEEAGVIADLETQLSDLLRSNAVDDLHYDPARDSSSYEPQILIYRTDGTSSADERRILLSQNDVTQLSGDAGSSAGAGTDGSSYHWQYVPGDLHDNNGQPTDRQRIVGLQLKLRSLGITPVVTGYIPESEVQSALSRLTSQFDAARNPQAAADRSQQEFSSTSAAAQLPAGSASTGGAGGDVSFSSDVDPQREQQITSLEQRIHDAGGRPEFTEPVTPSNVFRAIQVLSDQLERLLAIQRAQKEIDNSAVATDVLDTQERRIMALQQAIRDYREVPVITGDVPAGERANAILNLERQLREIVSRPAGFDANGVNTDPNSTDSLASQSETGRDLASKTADWKDALVTKDGERRAPSTELLDVFDHLKPYFRPGELEPLLARVFLASNALYDLDPAKQVNFFLKKLMTAFGLNYIESGAAGVVDTVTENYQRIQSIENQQKRNAAGLTFRESGFDPYGFLTEQWIPDSVAENLPGVLRRPIQAMLDYTSPIGALALITQLALSGGTVTAFSVFADIASKTTAQLLEEKGAPVLTQEVGGAIAGKSVESLPDALRGLRDLSDEKEFMKTIFGVASNYADESGKAALRKYANDLAERAAAEGIGMLPAFAADLGFAYMESWVKSEAAKGPIGPVKPDFEDSKWADSNLFSSEMPYPSVDQNLLDARSKADPVARSLLDDLIAQNTTTYEQAGIVSAIVASRTDLPSAERELAAQALGKRLRGEQTTALEEEALNDALGESFDAAINKVKHQTADREKARDIQQRALQSQATLSPAPPQPHPATPVLSAAPPQISRDMEKEEIRRAFRDHHFGEWELSILADAYENLVAGQPATTPERMIIKRRFGSQFLSEFEQRFSQPQG